MGSENKDCGQLRGCTKCFTHYDCLPSVDNAIILSESSESVSIKISGEAYRCLLDMQTRFNGMDLGTLIHTALHTLDFLKTKTMDNHSILIRNESSGRIEKYKFK